MELKEILAVGCMVALPYLGCIPTCRTEDGFLESRQRHMEFIKDKVTSRIRCGWFNPNSVKPIYWVEYENKGEIWIKDYVNGITIRKKQIPRIMYTDYSSRKSKL
ncbi:hypothetical protein COV15_01455 [Candidatus Woesearchaeota archaeon CG10_big_fil_rev_8_21_14_0_10_34_12]|nr:MAG: hypothetical protein COV15_01455 [Candidatus Woesearchaeota archaeon CG10_big_fil_rev_8_21_14_0_10_34_12]